MLARNSLSHSVGRSVGRLVGRSVGPSVGPLVGRSVGPSVGPSHMYSASGFRITAPAQSHVTDALVYTAPLTAPAPHITAPAQPHATDAVATALFFLRGLFSDIYGLIF